MGVFLNCFACKSREENDGAECGCDADAEDNKFAGTIANVSRGESFESSLSRAPKLAKKEKPGQTPNHARYQVGSKRDSRQAIQIVCEPERDRAETQQDHDFPPFFFHRGIDGAECRMPTQPPRYLIAEEPAGQTESARRTQCDTSERS